MHHFSLSDKKKLTKNIFHWLELITKILSFLQIFSERKTTTQLFLFQKLCQNINKENYISSIFWTFKSKLQIIHDVTYVTLFLPGSKNFVSYVWYQISISVSAIFSFCVFIFTFFILFSPWDTIYKLRSLIWFHYNLSVILRR